MLLLAERFFCAVMIVIVKFVPIFARATVAAVCVGTVVLASSIVFITFIDVCNEVFVHVKNVIGFARTLNVRMQILIYFYNFKIT